MARWRCSRATWAGESAGVHLDVNPAGEAQTTSEVGRGVAAQPRARLAPSFEVTHQSRLVMHAQVVVTLHGGASHWTSSRANPSLLFVSVLNAGGAAWLGLGVWVGRLSRERCGPDPHLADARVPANRHPVPVWIAIRRMTGV